MPAVSFQAMPGYAGLWRDDWIRTSGRFVPNEVSRHRRDYILKTIQNKNKKGPLEKTRVL